MNVFDASALLAYLRDETGAETVRNQLEIGGYCSAANWSEVAQKVRAGGGDWELARQLLLSYDLAIEVVDAADAEAAARLWRSGSGLSLADRLCLVLAARLGAIAWTSDTQWRDIDGVRLVR
jgi:PIN domain nuclease of toxin-antitoxin system